MIKQKKILAVIPARSGSKGLKDKNIKDLNGKPMIAYTIEAAIQSGVFTDIIVSTDSIKYANIAKEYGATVPFLRPEELATDRSSSIDMIDYTISELNNRGLRYENFMLLQPTSPLRKASDIINAFNLFNEKKANSVVSVCETEHSPKLMNTLNSTLRMDSFLEIESNRRRQELPTYYRLNGAIYLSNIDYFLRYKHFYKDKCYAYIMEQKNSIDIDSEVEFELVKVLMNKHGIS
ncbi:cytidylyltransferase domain-containing protein [Oceanobacillus massiliensis]|uniref:acylneuraminate cytidylyltransferase family protein n=1 Tax=Oceanobacillus massiliensis TaxID=1465765 RepID=UPI0002883507|nr:acylneuraminate cytidylyltransferase family protein [Oceanobacillus massiliensis]